MWVWVWGVLDIIEVRNKSFVIICFAACSTELSDLLELPTFSTVFTTTFVAWTGLFLDVDFYQNTLL